MFLSSARSGDVDTLIHCLAGGNVDVNVNNAVSSTFSHLLVLGRSHAVNVSLVRCCTVWLLPRDAVQCTAHPRPVIVIYFRLYFTVHNRSRVLGRVVPELRSLGDQVSQKLNNC